MALMGTWIMDGYRGCDVEPPRHCRAHDGWWTCSRTCGHDIWQAR